MTEKRLIDANALSKSINEGSGTELQKFFADVCVATAPTIDAVEVVRCKECEHCDWYTKTYELIGLSETKYWCSANKGPAVEVRAEHFCSYGERRTDD